MKTADEMLRDLKRRNLADAPIFRSDREDDEDRSQPIFPRIPKIAPIFRSDREDDEEDNARRRAMDRVWMECDIGKGMALGTSCVSHPLARLELLKMGYRP